MKNGIRKIVEFDPEILKKFQETFPELSYWVIINKLLAAFIEAYDNNPIDYAKIGAQYVKSELESL